MRDREETSVFRVPQSPACRAGHHSLHPRPCPRHGRIGRDADASTLACDCIPPRSHTGSVRCHSSQAPPASHPSHRVAIRKQRPFQHAPAICYHTAERTSSQFQCGESSSRASPHLRRTSDIISPRPWPEQCHRAQPPAYPHWAYRRLRRRNEPVAPDTAGKTSGAPARSGPEVPIICVDQST